MFFLISCPNMPVQSFREYLLPTDPVHFRMQDPYLIHGGLFGRRERESAPGFLEMIAKAFGHAIEDNLRTTALLVSGVSTPGALFEQYLINTFVLPYERIIQKSQQHL